ncbi:MAG: hypothetical protein HKM93_19665 [Desulfobacteraceae bacterium]|nr:hypothetical protein [Desulfobacteraceae bacterium]
MNFEIIFDHMPAYVLIRTEGAALDRDFDDLLTTLVDSPEWTIGTDQLLDHRNLIGSYLTWDHLDRISSIIKKHAEKLGNGRCGFVVPSDTGFGLVRMYEMMGGESVHREVQVFYSMDEAVEWISQ